VFAFEAHPFTFTFLEDNIKTNRLENVVPLNLAAGPARGHIKIKYESGNSGASHVTNESEQAIEVQMMTLDDALSERGIDDVDYLKIDVEGYEGFVLAGAHRLLRRNKKIIVQTEVDARHLKRYPQSRKLMVDSLTELGFAPHLLSDDGSLRRISLAELHYGDVIWAR
jgi:FkbM family methyltransferase